MLVMENHLLAMKLKNRKEERTRKEAKEEKKKVRKENKI